MEYTIKIEGKEGVDVVNVVCEEANINQDFLKEDVPELIKDIEGMLDK